MPVRADPDHLASQLVLLYDGARCRVSWAGSSAAAAAREMAALLLDAATAKAAPKKPATRARGQGGVDAVRAYLLTIVISRSLAVTSNIDSSS